MKSINHVTLNNVVRSSVYWLRILFASTVLCFLFQSVIQCIFAQEAQDVGSLNKQVEVFFQHGIFLCQNLFSPPF